MHDYRLNISDVIIDVCFRGASENEAETLSINNETHELRLYHPEGVTVDSSGNIYIVDTRNHCIQKLNSDSTWVFSFRIYGNKDGEFTYPKKLH